MDEKQLWGGEGVSYLAAVQWCLDVDVDGWASKVYEVWLIIARLCCRCPRVLSPLSSSLGTLQPSSDSVDGNYCLRNYFTDQTHFPSERNFNISSYRGSRFLTPQRRQSKVYLQVWSLIRPELRASPVFVIDRAANDPSVFTIMEKAPSRAKVIRVVC